MTVELTETPGSKRTRSLMSAIRPSSISRSVMTLTVAGTASTDFSLRVAVIVTLSTSATSLAGVSAAMAAVAESRAPSEAAAK